MPNYPEKGDLRLISTPLIPNSRNTRLRICHNCGEDVGDGSVCPKCNDQARWPKNQLPGVENNTGEFMMLQNSHGSIYSGDASWFQKMINHPLKRVISRDFWKGTIKHALGSGRPPVFFRDIASDFTPEHDATVFIFHELPRITRQGLIRPVLMANMQRNC